MFNRLRYEYWPWYFFFLPVLPVCFYWMIRTRKWLYFTATNPSIPLGGFFGEKKLDILSNIPDQYKTKSILIKPGEIPELEDWKFPLILKPNVGERGNGVVKILNEKELEATMASIDEDHILQEFCDYPFEFGVFYSRIPGSKDSEISSITLKKFMDVTGDGSSSVEQLMSKCIRFRKQISRLRKENHDILKLIPKSGETIRLEPRGNHCLGTEFINANYLIDPQMVKVFDQIVESYNGFNYGRFDLKANSLDSLKTGEGLAIFELNGVSSEPGHIYDVEYNLYKAYRDVSKHWYRMGKIAQANIKLGQKVSTSKEFINLAVRHFWK